MIDRIAGTRLLAGLCVLLLCACGDSGTAQQGMQGKETMDAGKAAVGTEAEAEMSTTTPSPVDYARPDAWLCRPGREDFCAVDLDTTVVMADGSTTIEPWAADPDAPIDCFYVYPTVSTDETPNSDLNPGPGEIGVVRSQFARFGEVCKTYAPLYRQITLTALRSRMAGQEVESDREMAYNDVKAAWRYYLENDNRGRGVVLIGHSQGSGMLTRLIAEEIDGKPIQSRLVSALIIGTRLPVPRGEVVGGAFESVPLCTSSEQTGCVVTYASFRDDIPPPEDSRFGRVEEQNMIAACTNPAALGGGIGELHAYLSAAGVGMSAGEQSAWVAGKSIDTPFVSVPGLLTAECVDNERGSYLAVTVHGDPEDPRTDDISGDVLANGEIQANWGLHLIDVHLAMGNLIDIVGAQGEAWLDKAR